MELRNPLALGPFPIFVITVISSPVVKCLLCKSHWEWLFHHDQLIAAVSTEPPGDFTERLPRKEKEIRVWGVLLAWDGAVSIVAMLCQNISGCFWPMKSLQRKYTGFGVFSFLVYSNMTSRVFMVTEGIKSFPLVAIIFIGFVILRSLMGGGVSISHRRQEGWRIW